MFIEVCFRAQRRTNTRWREWENFQLSIASHIILFDIGQPFADWTLNVCVYVCVCVEVERGEEKDIGLWRCFLRFNSGKMRVREIGRLTWWRWWCTLSYLPGWSQLDSSCFPMNMLELSDNYFISTNEVWMRWRWRKRSRDRRHCRRSHGERVREREKRPNWPPFTPLLSDYRLAWVVLLFFWFLIRYILSADFECLVKWEVHSMNEWVCDNEQYVSREN